MALTLSPATERRIQRETARGPYTAPDDFINQLLDAFEAEPSDLAHDREALIAKLQRGSDQIDRGEAYSPEEARAILAQRRAARAR
jgi:Arc/MetJ-type ribon-helix-helix transcriptional regulator